VHSFLGYRSLEKLFWIIERVFETTH